ncbi:MULTISPECIES: polysaccharide pyruvyl transferase family protein [unclassified Rhodococcus (in: high G+C Gram-positive bacteria)]|uniref:polysaccharide pyruvyl transferase family protein n=1 Tax=unclassified Rhodococcus (in: high G+C Gram-positive bacteria) TaxID=192944 RepID=UPI000ABF3B12|nr:MULTISPECIES: polysaccharide pyruvyl transferase family protein [unclassified Rhodococcus (in: high G+C Gram-positive bacteria)]
MTKVFMSINAAPGNIGDIYIRRQVVRAFDRQGIGGVLYAGSMPAEYLDAFHLSGRWKLASSYTKFLLQLISSYATRRCVFVMAPGPAELGSRLAPTLKHVLVTLVILVGRVTGNRVLVLGRAIRVHSRVGVLFEKIIVRSSNMYVVRDSTSSDLLSERKVQFAPDFAFGSKLESPNEEAMDRIYASISLRNDRIVNPAAISDLVARIRSTGLIPRLVVQVREDQATSSALAALVGIDIVSWEEYTSHSAQEDVILSAYRESSIVISDRLHALIFGAISGSIPIIVERTGEDKLHVTLDPVLGPQSLWLNGIQPVCEIDSSELERERIIFATRRAREDLEMIWTDILNLSDV